MKRWFAFTVLLGVAVVWAAVPVRAADNFAGPLKVQWERLRGLMVKSAEAVPEDKYDYKPTAGVRSFRELFVHVTEENYFFMNRASGETQKPPENLKTRAEIVKALNDSYDYGAKFLTGLTDEKAVEMVAGPGNRQQPRWGIAMANIIDNWDHYGNLVVYMRLNGLVPPSSQR